MKILKKIIVTVVSIFLLLLLTYNVYNFISTKVLKNDIAPVFGYAVLEVVSGSMEPTIHVGDMIIIDMNDTTYDKDDIITFYDKEGSFTTHRIISIEDGEIITKGDNNDSLDSEPIIESKIVGKYKFKLDGAGKILAAFKSPLTMVMILIIGILVCVLMSTDKDGNPILEEEEKEYEEFLKYQNQKSKQKEENIETSASPKKSSTEKKKKSEPNLDAKITVKEVKNDKTRKKKTNTEAKMSVKTVEEKPKAKSSTNTKKKTQTKAKVTVKTVPEKKSTSDTKKKSQTATSAKKKKNPNNTTKAKGATPKKK